LAAEGARVIVAARTRDEIESVAAGLRTSGASAHAVECDVSDPRSIEQLADAARQLFSVSRRFFPEW
jgi:NAD(P)-dependent dehydrogenase (short-subunit alcohol dehydrogenase family)